MITDAVRQQYTATIGIECHVQLKTKTKLFSGAGNDAREAPPNTLVNHIDFGYPGALPVLNQEAVHLAVKAAFALGTEPQKFSKFDRKHYFYPDLPMGYQISQYDEPTILGGFVDIVVDGEKKRITITRAHMEADAGKSTHPAGQDYSLVDLNRAGTPLIEIVSEPEMHSGAEAKAYAHELYLRMRYADVSDCNLYYGNMRFDVNVSVSKTSDLGTRTETKNLNSFRAVEKAVDYEITRQIAQLENGEAIVQETRGWDDSKQQTFSQRTKENADDYRYFPDPDLPPIVLEESYIEAVRKEMPVMPDEWRSRLSTLGLDTSQIETLLDAQVELASEGYLSLLEAAMADVPLAKQIANWLVNIDIPFIRENNLTAQVDRLDLYRQLAQLVADNKLSSTNAKALIKDILRQHGIKPGDDRANAPSTLYASATISGGSSLLVVDVQVFANDNGYIQVSDEVEITRVVDQVIAENPKPVEDIKNGEMKAIGFLVGQVMKASQGKANPALAQQLIKKQLGL